MRGRGIGSEDFDYKNFEYDPSDPGKAPPRRKRSLGQKIKRSFKKLSSKAARLFGNHGMRSRRELDRNMKLHEDFFKKAKNDPAYVGHSYRNTDDTSHFDNYEFDVRRTDHPRNSPQSISLRPYPPWPEMKGYDEQMKSFREQQRKWKDKIT